MNIYYPIAKKFSNAVTQCLSAVLILLISFIAFQPNAHADFRTKTAEEYRIKGYEEQQKGNYRKALEYYVKSLSLSPDNHVIFNDMGVVYEHVGLDEQAEKFYLDAIRVNKEYLPPYMNLAYLYERKGDIARAVMFFEKRINMDSKKDRWAQQARDEIARLSPARFAEITKEDRDRLARAMIEQSRKEFMKEISRADEHYKKGRKLFKRRMYPEAVEQYDQALKLTPENPKILRARQDAVEEQKKREVKQRTEQALKMLNAGDVDAAKEEYQKILATLPNEPPQQSE